MIISRFLADEEKKTKSTIPHQNRAFTRESISRNEDGVLDRGGLRDKNSQNTRIRNALEQAIGARIGRSKIAKDICSLYWRGALVKCLTLASGNRGNFASY